MPYDIELNKLSRRKIDYVKIITGFCDNSYGVSPCTASGAFKCYNTFPTCQDKPNFIKITKEYTFINADLPVSVLNSYYGTRPFIKSISSLPAEIKDNDTVSKRLKVELYDTTDNDIGIDPYSSERIAMGDYWKKWIARNPNYKGAILEYYEGFENISLSDYKLKFRGKLDNITVNKNVATIESVGLLKSLADYKYPLKTSVYITEDIPMYFEAASEQGLLSLNARINDYAMVSLFSDITGNHTLISGSIPPSTCAFSIIGYDEANRPIARDQLEVSIPYISSGVHLFWTAASGVSYYRIYGGYKRIYPSIPQYFFGQTQLLSLDIYDIAGEVENEPSAAQRLYKLTESDPSVIGNWEFVGTAMTVKVSDVSIFNPEGGYFKVAKEIIGYSGLNGEYFTGISRMQLKTEADYHYIYDTIYAMLEYRSPLNPFLAMQNVLALANIDTSYIDQKFSDYQDSYSGPEVTLGIIAKDTTLAVLFFDLVNLCDCLCWEGEDGLIKILNHDEDPATAVTVNDSDNIIEGSSKIDLNEASRKTRWILYWNRYDYEKGVKEAQAYNRITAVVDATAENANEYGDIQEDVQYTAWLSEGSDDITTIRTYIQQLLEKRQARTRDARLYFMCEQELKDNNILTGQVIELSTADLQDKDGRDYNGVEFRVMRKEQNNNKISFKYQRRVKVISTPSIAVSSTSTESP